MVMVTSLMETGERLLIMSCASFKTLLSVVVTTQEMQQLFEIAFVNMSMDQARCHGNGKSSFLRSLIFSFTVKQLKNNII